MAAAGTGGSADRWAEATRRLEFEVDGDWTAAEFEGFLRAVRRVYDGNLLLYLRQASRSRESARGAEVFRGPEAFQILPEARGAGEEPTFAYRSTRVPPGSWLGPGGLGSLAAAGLAHEITTDLVRERLSAIAPEAQLRLASVQMSSTGLVSLEGSGEIIKETGGLFERLTLLNQRRVALKLENDRKRRENVRDGMKDELEVTRELIETLEEFLRLKWGEDFRAEAEAQRAITEVLSGAISIYELMGAGKLLLLPAPEEDAGSAT